ncbi:MAG: EamA family transporter [Acidimicrobiia bacterium]
MGKLRDSVSTAAAPLAWGTTYAVTTELLPADRPLFTATMRALPVGIAFTVVTRRMPTGAWWLRAAVLGLLNIGAFLALLFVATYRLPGGLVATLVAILPVIVLLLAWPVLGERPGARSALVAVVCLVGVGLVGSAGAGDIDGWGALAALGAATVLGFGTVLTKYWGRPFSLVAFTGWQLLFGGLAILPLAWVVEGPPPAIDVRAALGYAYLQAIGTGLAYLVWFRGIERLPVALPPLIGLLNPVVAVLIGWRALDQRLTAVQVGGVTIVLLGVAASGTGPDSGRRLSRVADAPASEWSEASQPGTSQPNG